VCKLFHVNVARTNGSKSINMASGLHRQLHFIAYGVEQDLFNRWIGNKARALYQFERGRLGKAARQKIDCFFPKVQLSDFHA
jgi:hypothetical protein